MIHLGRSTACPVDAIASATPASAREHSVIPTESGYLNEPSSSTLDDHGRLRKIRITAENVLATYRARRSALSSLGSCLLTSSRISGGITSIRGNRFPLETSSDTGFTGATWTQRPPVPQGMPADITGSRDEHGPRPNTKGVGSADPIVEEDTARFSALATDANAPR